MVEVMPPCWSHVTVLEVMPHARGHLHFHSVLKHNSDQYLHLGREWRLFPFFLLLQSPPFILFRCKPCSLHLYEREKTVEFW